MKRGIKYYSIIAFVVFALTILTISIFWNSSSSNKNNVSLVKSTATESADLTSNTETQESDLPQFNILSIIHRFIPN